MAADTYSDGVVRHHTLPDQTSTDALPNRLSGASSVPAPR